jgi:hypothetical protein
MKKDNEELGGVALVIHEYLGEKIDDPSQMVSVLISILSKFCKDSSDPKKAFDLIRSLIDSAEEACNRLGNRE